MNSTFAGQVAVVTGGASGIGRACAELLAERGAKVVVLDLNADAAAEVARQLGGKSWRLDVTSVDDIEAMAARIEAEVGPVDMLINSAGILQGQSVPPDQVPFATFNRVFEVNLRGTHACCVSFGQRMAQRRRGAIVNLGSISGMRSTPLHAYGPMKAAVIGLTENLAGEWGPRGVRVNCISPGAVLTPAMQVSIDLGLRDSSRMAAESARGLMVATREVAKAAAFLLSDEASGITGVNLPVDHGWLVAMSWPFFGGLRS